MYFKLALGNVKKSLRDYGVYFLTLVFGVCVFYAFNSIASQQTVLDLNEAQNSLVDLLSTLIGGVSVFIAVILGFLIVYASRYLIRRRKKEFGTYLLLGMSSGKVSRIIVYETLFVGVISLAVGLLAGFLVSQGLLYITAALFTVKMDMFAFVFSMEAFTKTLLYFGVIFLVALIFNTITISRFKLIDLINADRKNETLKLRSLPLSVVLFIVAVVLIGISYVMLWDNGLQEFDEMFAACTAIVCVGTLLLFYSLSGFLLRAVQMNKRLYYRGLNMFTLRQLNSKINTAFLSITLVCMTLFLAITATCGGFALCESFTENLEATTQYDASLKAFYSEDETFEGEATEARPWLQNAIDDNYDMQAALRREVPEWDSVVKSASQTNVYFSEFMFQQALDATGVTLNNSLNLDNVKKTPVSIVRLSDFNAQRALLGLDPLTIEGEKYILWCDFEETKPVFAELLARESVITVFGVDLVPASQHLEDISSEVTALAMNTGSVIVPDDAIPGDAKPDFSTLNVMYNGTREDGEALFTNALDSKYKAKWEEDTTLIGWPFMQVTTAVEAISQSVGLSVVIAYLAIYIGLVLLLACAAILALQQLSEAADNVARYALLEKLGVEQKMINKALFTQIGIYFIFPLIVALCHAGVALKIVVDVASLYGRLNIAVPLAATIAIFLAVYGGYFLMTYFGSRTMVHQTSKAKA